VLAHSGASASAVERLAATRDEHAALLSPREGGDLLVGAVGQAVEQKKFQE